MPAFLAYETSNYGTSIHHDDTGISSGLLLTRGVLDSATDTHHHHTTTSSSTSTKNNTYTSFSTNSGFTTFSHQSNPKEYRNNNTSNRIRDDDDAFSDDDDDDGPGFEIGGVDNELSVDTSTASSVITNHSIMNGRMNNTNNDGVDTTNGMSVRNSSAGLYTGSGSIDYTHEDLPPHPADTPQLSSTSSHRTTGKHRMASSISSALSGNTSLGGMKNSLNMNDADNGFSTSVIDKLTATPNNNGFTTFDNTGETNSTGYVYSPEDTSSITGTVNSNTNGMTVSWPSTGGKKRGRQTAAAATVAAKAAAAALAVAAAVTASSQSIYYTDNNNTTQTTSKKKNSKASNAANTSTQNNNNANDTSIDHPSTDNTTSSNTNLTTKFNETTGTPRRTKGKKNTENADTPSKSSIVSTSNPGTTSSTAMNDATSTVTSTATSVTGTPTSAARARKKSRVETTVATASNSIDSSSDVPTDQDTTAEAITSKTSRQTGTTKVRRQSLKNITARPVLGNTSSITSSSALTISNPNMLSIGSGGSLDAYAMTLVLLPAPDNNIKSLNSGHESTASGDIDYSHNVIYPPGTLLRTKDPAKDGVRPTHTLIERTLTQVEGNWTLLQDYLLSGHKIPVTDHCMVPLGDPGPNRICPGYCGYVDLYTKLTYLARMSTRQILSIGLRSYNRLPCAMWVDPSKVLGEFFVVSYTLPGFFHSCPIHGTDKKTVKWKKSGSPQMRPMELSETYDAVNTPVQLMSQFAVARCIRTNVKLYSARVSCVVKDHLAQGIFMVQVRDARENTHQTVLMPNNTSSSSAARTTAVEEEDDA